MPKGTADVPVTQEPGADAELGTEIEMQSPTEEHTAERKGKAAAQRGGEKSGRGSDGGTGALPVLNGNWWASAATFQS